jgi:transcriptional regulator with XRE-family HTH domain
MTAAEQDWPRLGAALRIARQHRGLSQEEVAEAARVSIASVQAAEAGKAPRARMPYTLAPIARALGWPAGAVEEVLRGGRAPGMDEAADLAKRIERLTPKQRAAIAALLEAFESRA